LKNRRATLNRSNFWHTLEVVDNIAKHTDQSPGCVGPALFTMIIGKAPDQGVLTKKIWLDMSMGMSLLGMPKMVL